MSPHAQPGHSDRSENNSQIPVEATAQEVQDDALIGQAFRASAMIISCCALLFGIGLYLFQMKSKTPVTMETPLELPTMRDEQAIEIPQLPFTDITEAAGIHFKHENGAHGEKLLPETMGGGCAFFDCDSDGDQDILLVNSTTWDAYNSGLPSGHGFKLYVNDGAGLFTDQTEQRGLQLELYGMGVACGDYNNDGYTDVFISALGTNRLFQNVNGAFQDVTDSAGVAGDKSAWSTSCGWFDYDNDGLLDLFVCNYLNWTRDFDLAQNFQLTGGGRAYGQPQVFPGALSYLYHNAGNGTFEDVSKSAGIQITNPATNVPMGKSLGVTFDDFDNDGYLDIFVSNDTVRNFLFRNQGNGTFEEVGIPSGVAYDTQGHVRGAMGLDSGRFRNHEAIGIAIGNFANEMTALYVAPHADLQFTDEAVSTGLGPRTRLEMTFGLFFFDCDLDGRLDLFTANGHLEKDINKVQASQFYKQPPQLFWNAGPESITEFIQVPPSHTSPDFNKRIVGRGAAYADIDADGDLDILIAASGQQPRLLRNDQQQQRNWLRFNLIGRQSNRNAIGSRITLITKTATRSRRVMPTRSYLSQVELPVTFGLGSESNIQEVVIDWPCGNKRRLIEFELNKTATITENFE